MTKQCMSVISVMSDRVKVLAPGMIDGIWIATELMFKMYDVVIVEGSIILGVATKSFVIYNENGGATLKITDDNLRLIEPKTGLMYSLSMFGKPSKIYFCSDDTGKIVSIYPIIPSSSEKKSSFPKPFTASKSAPAPAPAPDKELP